MFSLIIPSKLQKRGSANPVITSKFKFAFCGLLILLFMQVTAVHATETPRATEAFHEAESLHESEALHATESLFATENLHETDNLPDSLKQYDLDEFVITATKTQRNPLEIPSRISMIQGDIINMSATMQMDDVLRFIPGANVNRSTGIYSQRPMVTLRGLSGDEQARTLVLMNGVPINTSDDGGVNWNRINHHDIERVEVFRGPGSSLYGNNAMGGVINLITKNPVSPQEINTGVSIGTHQTIRQDLNVRIRNDDGHYGVLSQYYLQSDGFNNVPEEDRTPFDIERFLEAIGVSARVGYDNSQWFNWELQYDVFRDKRGEGHQIHVPDGTYRNFDTNLFRGQLSGSNHNTMYNLSAFFQTENYYNINENMRGENYERFDVDAARKDMGIIFSLNRQLSDQNTLTGGFEYKLGSIEGGDYFQTAPYDTVYNEGRLATMGGYLQNEYSFSDDRIHLIAGLRLDRATLSDGDYYSTDPWSTIPELTDHTWTALSPRAGLRFNFWDNLSTYLSYSRGFRASILDDLTRTGWMWVGPKYANPELEPESIDNYEAGFDLSAGQHLKVSSSAFIMRGKDFLYYVETGDQIFGRPIFRRENVTNVRVRGLETEITYDPGNNLMISSGYTYNHSVITGFEARPELEDNYLKYVPAHNANVSLFWTAPWVNLSVRGLYKGTQYADDANEQELDDYVTVDLMLSRNIRSHYTLSLDIQNVFDNRHMETIQYMSPGRLITARVALNI